MKKYLNAKYYLVFIIFIVIAVRFFIYYRNLRFNRFPNGTKIRISARVLSEPVIYSDSQYIKLMQYKVYLPLYPRIFYGDRIAVEGIVEDKKLKNAKLLKIMANDNFLYKYREKLISFYESSLPKDHSALVAGMVIGSKSGIGEELWNLLVKSGTAHVVVASGMNVSMIAGFLIGALVLFLPRRRAVILAIVGIWLYSIISGFEAPIVRASVMGSTAFLAIITGRMYSSFRILIITALLLLFFKPVWVNDLGFWLSFLATASIIIFYRKVKKAFYFVPKIINEDWSTTLSAQIGVVPLLYYYFGQFNILSPIINVAVLWTVVPITIIGMLAGIIGTVIEPLGRGILYLCYPLTSWFLFVVNIFT